MPERGRPKKPDNERRRKQVTVYLTDAQYEWLRLLSGRGGSLSRTLTEALRQYAARQMEPPEAMRRAVHDEAMKKDTELAQGYVCARGHVFWGRLIEPMPVQTCPFCETKHLQRIWAGIVKKDNV